MYEASTAFLSDTLMVGQAVTGPQYETSVAGEG